MAEITLFGAKGSGSIAVEAAFTLLGVPYSLVEGATWTDEEARQWSPPARTGRGVRHGSWNQRQESDCLRLEPGLG